MRRVLAPCIKLNRETSLKANVEINLRLETSLKATWHVRFVEINLRYELNTNHIFFEYKKNCFVGGTDLRIAFFSWCFFTAPSHYVNAAIGSFKIGLLVQCLAI